MSRIALGFIFCMFVIGVVIYAGMQLRNSQELACVRLQDELCKFLVTCGYQEDEKTCHDELKREEVCKNPQSPTSDIDQCTNQVKHIISCEEPIPQICWDLH